MKCLETRQRNGLKWRRYRTEDGRTVTTFELPTSVLRGITTAARLNARLETWRRGEAQRTRRAAVLKRLAQGVKPAAVAHEFGLSDREVQRIRKRMLEAA